MQRINLAHWLTPLLLLLVRIVPAQMSDCQDAVVVCQTVFQQSDAPLSEGALAGEIPLTSCLVTGEKNGGWYRFTIQQGGQLCFSLKPNSPEDDYDWAIYHLTGRPCSDIPAGLAPEVSCNFAPNTGCNGVTGPTGQTADSCLEQHEPCLTVQAGETYLVYVSQFTASSTDGYQLDFSASTASIYDQEPPRLQEAVLPCDSNQLRIRFSEPVQCQSVQASDFVLSGPGGVFPLAKLTNLPCATGQLFASEFWASLREVPTQHGNYTLQLVGEVSDACGNVSLPNQSHPVGVAGEPLRVELAQDSLCQGDSLRLSSNYADLGGFRFFWNTGDTLPSPVALADTSGWLHLTATAPGGCLARDSMAITVYPTPYLALQGDDSICLAHTAEARLSQAPPAGSELRWDFGGASFRAGVGQGPYQLQWSDPGRYQVQVSATLGQCRYEAPPWPVEVLPHPRAYAGPDTLLCQGQRLTLPGQARGGVPPFAYLWQTSLPSGLPERHAAQPQVEPRQSGPYWLQVSAYGCWSLPDSVWVEVADALTVSVEADTNRVCQGDAAQLRASGGSPGAQYRWQPPAGLSSPTQPRPIARPDTTTTYVVTLQQGQCSDTAAFTLAVNPAPRADYFNTLATGCGQLEVSFIENTADAVAYVWDFGDGSPLSNEPSPIHTYQEPGSYLVSFTAIGEGGCTSSVSQTTVEVTPGPQASIHALPAAGQRLPVGTTVELNAPGSNTVTWLWSLGDGQTASGPTVRHRYDRPGTYLIEVTIADHYGCSRTLTYGPYEVFQPEVKLQNVFTPNGDGANDEFTIGYNGQGEYELLVYDRWGRRFFLSQSPDRGWNGLTSEGKAAPEGVYFYNAMIDGEVYQGSVTLMR